MIQSVQTLSYRAPHANYENQKMLINDRINEQATPSALKLDSKVSWKVSLGKY